MTFSFHLKKTHSILLVYISSGFVLERKWNRTQHIDGHVFDIYLSTNIYISEDYLARVVVPIQFT